MVQPLYLSYPSYLSYLSYPSSLSFPLDRRIPTMNRELAVTERFGRRQLARRDREHFGEEPIGRAIQRLAVIDAAADVDVGVAGHLPRGARVPRHLDHGRNGIAGGRAQPGRKDHDLRAAA